MSDFKRPPPPSFRKRWTFMAFVLLNISLNFYKPYRSVFWSYKYENMRNEYIPQNYKDLALSLIRHAHASKKLTF